MKKTMFCLTGLAAMGLAAAVTIDPGKGVAVSPGKITGTTDVDVFSGIVTMDASNDYVGTTRITNGTLIATKLAPAGNPSSIGSSGTIDVGNAIFKYTGTEAVTIDRQFVNTVSVLNSTGVVEVLDLQGDVTFTKSFSSGYMPFVKMGPGAMIMKANADILISQPSTGYNRTGLKPNEMLEISDGVPPVKGVTAPLTVLDGSIILRSGTFRTKQSSGLSHIGGWTAGYGEAEKDVYLTLDGGNVTFATVTDVGQLHGFADYNTPNGPAKAYVTINSGTLTQAGGQGFWLGSSTAPPTVKINGVDTELTMNSDLRLTVNAGGTFTHGESFAGLKLAQRQGQTAKVLVDGGTLNDRMVLIGQNATAKDTTATVDIDVRNSGIFRCESFSNNVSNKASPPPVNVRVTSGARFQADNMVNCGSGTLNFYLDGCSLENHAVNARFLDMRKIVLCSTVTSAQIGTNAVTLVGRGTNSGKPHVAVFAAPFTTSSELVAAGEPDGGVIVKNNTPSNVVEFAAAMAYAGPTVLEEGVLAFSGSGALPSATAFTMTGGTLLLDGNRVLTVGSAVLGSTFETPILALGPGASLTVSGEVAFGGTMALTFVDASGNDVTSAVTRHAVMTVPDAQAAALCAARFVVASGKLTLTALEVESNGNGTSTLYASAVPTATIAFAPDFALSTMSADSQSHYVLDCSALVAAADGTYTLATFAKTGDETYVDSFADVFVEWKSATLAESATGTPGVWQVTLTLESTGAATGEWIPVSAGGGWNVAANWTGAVPDGAGQTAYFPEAALADVPVAVDSDVTAGSVMFSAGATPGGYRLSGGGSLTLASNVAAEARPGIALDAAADAAAHVHSIAVPVTATCAQNWGVPTNQTLVLEKGVTAPALTISSGSTAVGGTVVMGGTNVIDGRLVLSNGLVRLIGKVTSPTGLDETDAAANGKTTMYVRFQNDETAAYLTMSNAVVEKPLFLYVGRSGDPLKWWHLSPASTNVMRGYLYHNFQSGMINFDGPGIRLDLLGGGYTSYSLTSVGSTQGSVVYVGVKPFNFYSYRVGAEQTLILDVPGSKFRNKSGSPCGLHAEGANGKVDFRVSYAMEGMIHGNGQSGFLYEFNTTTQRVDTVCRMYNTSMNGTYPAMCEIVDGHPESASGNRVSNVCCQVTGGLGFIMSGPSTICLSNKVFQSHGDIAVVSGKMVFAANASWLNGTNVTVAGTGTLRINAADTFSRSHAVIRFADSGKVELPSGVTQTFAEGWDGETKLVAGRTYTAANLPERVSGAGAIRIAGSGFSVFIR